LYNNDVCLDMPTLKCENCGAPFKGQISPYQKFVKCPYCNAIIKIDQNESNVIKKKIRVIEEVIQESKRTFDINDFASFLNRFGIKSFDPVSGILQMGSTEVRVTEEGAVEGKEPLKSRVEKWVQKYMSEC